MLTEREVCAVATSDRLAAVGGGVALVTMGWLRLAVLGTLLQVVGVRPGRELAARSLLVARVVRVAHLLARRGAVVRTHRAGVARFTLQLERAICLNLLAREALGAC